MNCRLKISTNQEVLTDEIKYRLYVALTIFKNVNNKTKLN